MTTFKRFLTLFLIASLSISAWGANYSETIGYSTLGSMLSGNYTDASSYWKVPGTAGNSATITIPASYFTNQPTSDVTLTFSIATFGGGNNPTSSNTTITAVGSETSSTWSGSSVATYPSSSTYVNGVMTLTKAASPTTLGGLTITMGVNTGVKIFRLQSIKIEYTYTDSGPYTVTLSKNGSTSDITGCTGTYILPTEGAHVSEACSGWPFHCWTNAPYSPSTPTTIAPSTTKITTMNAAGTAYAVYKHITGGGSSNATINFGYSDWGKAAQYSADAYDVVTQTNSGITVTQTRNGSSMYANSTSTRFYGSNTLSFTSSIGNITSIVFTCSSYQSDITSDVGTCTSTSSEFSWSGDATSVTFTRTGSSYAQFSVATVTTTTGTITYTSSPTCLPACATPTFSVPGGSYTSEQTVTISCETGGATIYYTTDGTTPTTSSSVYSTPVVIPKGAITTLQAIAVKDGLDNSAIAGATYDIRVYNITLSIDGATTALADVAHGTLLSTYNALVTDCSKWTHVGWSKVERTSQTITDEMTLVTEVDAACTYYAVFRNTKSGTHNAEFVFADLAADYSWENGIRYSPITVGAATLTASSGGINGKYYTGDQTWRLYSTTSPKGTATITVSGGTINSVTSNPSKTFSISTNTASFTASSANVSFKSITVNYTAEENYYSTNATCEPVWTITFNGNGNTSGTAPEAIEVVKTQSTTLPTVGTLEKTHYTFGGWNTQPDGLGTNYAAGSSHTPTADITLYAKWIEAAKYTITWDDGHSDPLPTTQVYAGDKVVLPADPTSCSATYTNFVGWYTSPEGTESTPSVSISGTKVTAQTKPTSDTRYYAVFANGGTIATSKQYAFDITTEDFTTGGYDANNGEHTSTATATDASGATFEVTWTSYGIYKYSGKMQWQKATSTNYQSWIYNNTDLQYLNAVTVTKSDEEAKFTIFSGSSENPEDDGGEGADITIGDKYFTLYNWDVTTRFTTNIHVVFTATGGTSAASGYITSCSTPTTWTVNYNANGKEISVGYALPSAATGIPEDTPFDVPDDNYVATPGFAQIGWNTDPSATSGLTTVPGQSAGTIITLYAIWQKSQIEVAEVDANDNIILDHNYGGATTATLDQLVPAVDGSTANDIFFSKYYESTANVKLIAIFNGTNGDQDISELRIRIPWYDDKQYKYKDRLIHMDTLLNHPGRSTILKRGEELILYSWQPTSKAGDCYRDNAILESAADKADMSKWIPLAYKYAVDSGKHALCYGGREAIVLESHKTGSWQPIDVIGAIDASGHSIYATSTPSWGDATGWICASGKSIEDTTEVIGISTNRCLLVRKFSVVDGSKAVAQNIGDGATFATLCDEWYGLHVKKYSTGSGSGCTPYLKDNNSAADGFSFVGDYDYNSQYQKYEEVAETKFTATYDPATGFTTIHINKCTGAPDDNCVEGGLAGLACDYLKITVRNADKSQVLDKLEYKVPIIISDAKTTNDAIFSSETECETCDVVVLGTGTLTKADNGSAGDQPKVRNLMVYPDGTLIVPTGTTYNADSVIFRVQGENTPKAKLVGTLHSVNEKITVTRRLTNARPYFFSLPYDCNINDITWSNGEKPTINTDFRVMTYNGQQRADNGSANNGRWWTTLNAGDVIRAGVGYNIQSAYKHMKELVFPMAIPSTNLTSAEDAKSTTVAVEKHENGSTTINNHNWNLIAQPYICQLTPNEGDKIRAGWLKWHYEGDNVVWERQEVGNVYMTMPDFNADKITYTQSLWSKPGMKLDPFVAFFVQAAGNGYYSFEKSNRILSAPKRHLASKAEIEDESIFVGVTLSRGENSDQTNVRIRPDFTNEYQLGFDLEKYLTYYTERPQIYMKTPDYRMAFQAVNDSVAKSTWLPVGVYGEQAGTYIFALSEDYPLDEVEAVYLHDNETGTTTNLLYDTYSFTTTGRVYTESRFSLNVIVNRRTPQITTDISITDAPDGVVRKLLINGHVFIQHGNKIYSITGNQVTNQ